MAVLDGGRSGGGDSTKTAEDKEFAAEVARRVARDLGVEPEGSLEKSTGERLADDLRRILEDLSAMAGSAVAEAAPCGEMPDPPLLGLADAHPVVALEVENLAVAALSMKDGLRSPGMEALRRATNFMGREIKVQAESRCLYWEEWLGLPWVVGSTKRHAPDWKADGRSEEIEGAASVLERLALRRVNDILSKPTADREREMASIAGFEWAPPVVRLEILFAAFESVWDHVPPPFFLCGPLRRFLRCESGAFAVPERPPILKDAPPFLLSAFDGLQGVPEGPRSYLLASWLNDMAYSRVRLLAAVLRTGSVDEIADMEADLEELEILAEEFPDG